MITTKEFKNEVMIIAKKIGVVPKDIHFRRMKRKEASCSSKGRLTFDISLLEEPKEIRYKVIIHELLHLRYHNHSKMFKIMVNTYLQKCLKEELI